VTGPFFICAMPPHADQSQLFEDERLPHGLLYRPDFLNASRPRHFSTHW